jgi:hypothetical protein
MENFSTATQSKQKAIAYLFSVYIVWLLRFFPHSLQETQEFINRKDYQKIFPLQTHL